MRKRFISGLTAVCMLGILLANSFLSVPASAVIAEVGASVAAGLLMGTLFNQMTGGTGYDFTDAFADCFSFATKPHDQFIRDNPDADIYLPDGTPYYVDGQYVTEIDLKKGEAEIASSIQSHWNIAESLGIKTPQETIHAAMEAFNAGLADGSIVIHVDDDGNISMPTSSWCTSVSDIYSRLGVYTSKDGTNRSRTYWSLVSPYIETTYDSWSVTLHAYDYMKSAGEVDFYQYAIQNDRLFIFKQYISCELLRLHCYYSNNTYDTCGDLYKSWINYFSTAKDYYFAICHSFEFSEDNSLVSMSIGCDETSETVSKSYAISGVPNSCFGSQIFDPNASVQARGIIQLKNGSDNLDQFRIQAQEGAIQSKENHEKIPLTGVENTIGNMGLAGVGAGATKGTVSVDSKTKDITVTNEATKEAELVIEQGKPGDIDIPDNDTIIDKFPFSLPFDLYRMLTIFVVPEQKPIFKFPIETTITNGGLNYKIDEEIEVDLTRFQFMGQDIVRLVLRSTFYVGFVIMLIHVTSKFIKH